VGTDPPAPDVLAPPAPVVAGAGMSVFDAQDIAMRNGTTIPPRADNCLGIP
jgi:hypothetical protein